MPGAGQIADFRDTVANAKNVAKNPKSGQAWAGLGGALVGWAPGLGDAAKGAFKVGKKVAAGAGPEVLEQASRHAADVSSAGGKTAKQTVAETQSQIGRQSPQPYEVGTYNELKAGDLLGDQLGNHHVPQKAEAKTLVPGYPADKMAGDAPAIRLPDPEHRKITELQSKRDTTGKTSRDLLADDIQMLKQNTDAPRGARQELIKMNKSKYPEAYEKKE